MPNSYSSTGTTLGTAAWMRAPAGRAPEPGCPQQPSCPACGGLDCLCRPRFFAGQLLTEDDLNRLENYVVNKNKLHNRYLHGWGVVCGLEVVCDPCGQGVVVRSGYALAPCGEDIVVCADQSVDVCGLIQACRPPDATPCPPAVALGTSTPTYSSYVGLGVGQPASGPCGDTVDRWVLAVCYDEQTSRGVMPLRPKSSACGCGASKSAGVCGCGGGKTTTKAAGCGCGCGTKGKSNGGAKTCGCSGAKAAAPASRAASCEPTLICEGFRFVVYKEATRDPVRVGMSSDGALDKAVTADGGPLIDRILCCWQGILSRLQRVPVGQDNVARARWLCDMRASLLDFVTSYPTYDCGLAAEVRAIVCPDPQQSDFDTAFLRGVVAIGAVGADYMRYCVCQALLPPCPEPIDGNCVPLAMIEVRRSDCRITDICNWGPRRLALTFPQLEYWASPLHLGDRLSTVLERLCCVAMPRERGVKVPDEEDIGVVSHHLAMSIDAAPPPAAPPPVAEPAPKPIPVEGHGLNASQAAVLLGLQSFKNQGRTIDAATVLLDALGLVDGDGRPLLTQFERASPVSLLLANQLTQPLVSSSVPTASADKGSVLGTMARLLAGAGAPAAAAASGGDVVELRRTVEELKRAVAAQGDELKKLRARRPPEK